MTYGELARQSSSRGSVLMTLTGLSFFGIMASIVFGFGALIMGFGGGTNTLVWCGIMLVSMVVVAPSAILLENNNRGNAANKSYASHRRDELIGNTNVLLFVLYHELSGDELRTIDFGWSGRHLGDWVTREEILMKAGWDLHVPPARIDAAIDALCKRHVLISCCFRPGNEAREICPRVFLIGQHVLDRLAERVLVENVHVPDHVELPRQYDFSDLL